MISKRLSSFRVAGTLALTLLLGLGWQQGLADEGLDARIEQLKGEVAVLSQELLELQEATLFPADTRVFLFLSLVNKDALVPESIEIAIDGRPVATHLYSPHEKEALQQGGLQRLYAGNLAVGEHRLEIKLAAQTGNERYVRRESELMFRKRAGESSIEVQLGATAPDFEPTMTLQDWQ
ncbi:AraC family transcriptional regulator [Marinobacter zhejiangensis]|uniref:AraC family transcriptional regulator n=1 Tax=Marinobacter zhejiangensis TaxID=488535 RepID=A0A1I4RQR3_9GAMM|nr:AraC family transcriptional regulator [Marinobacter zhejiangensis]SFM54489.1 hypothetical protein SAMN04487963_2893 [Marinobacter zhejiangensis]